MAVRIYAMTHKKFEQPDKKIYVPLHVGRAAAAELGYPGDNTGDHISEKNCYYAELSGVYWVWKNVHDVDFVGICHYRRYLLNEKKKLFGELEIENLLRHKGIDIITTKKVMLDVSYYEGFGGKHNIQDLIETGNVIRELYPSYYPLFAKMVQEKETYFGNMMICSKTLFDQYADWLFHIFFALEKRIHPEQYDDYRKRVYGFISEFLLYVWVTYHQLRALECDVAVMGEKKETVETKRKIAEYFEKKDVQGAKSYFTSIYHKRPDILMEASDFDGELKLAMQAITTCEYEMKQYGTCILNHTTNFKEIIDDYRQLNQIVTHYKSKEETEQDVRYLIHNKVNEVAIQVAVRIQSDQECIMKELCQRIKESIQKYQSSEPIRKASEGVL